MAICIDAGNCAPAALNTYTVIHICVYINYSRVYPKR